MEHILRLFTTFFLFFPSLGVCPHEARLENLDEEDLRALPCLHPALKVHLHPVLRVYLHGQVLHLRKQ